MDRITGFEPVDVGSIPAGGTRIELSGFFVAEIRSD